MSDEEEEVEVKKKKSEAPPPRRRPKKIIIPRRAPSIVIPPKKPFYPSADKSTCAKCTCYPKEDPYVKPKKLNADQHSPLTLYELAAKVVDGLRLPPAFQWTVEDVAQWCEEQLNLPQYKDCMFDNHIDGMRLLMLEDPSKLPQINIHNFQHIQMITRQIRKEYGTDFVRFVRSINVPPRKPLTHCTWFKSRTGPSCGIRKNWTRYRKPDFPSVKYARVSKAKTHPIPHYKKGKEEVCKEYQVPRKFRLQTGIPEEEQMIWMERRPETAMWEEEKNKLKAQKKKKKEKRVIKFLISDQSTLLPKKLVMEGLRGDAFKLARRLMPKPKFLA